MAPRSSESVSRIYLTEGVFILGLMLNSIDEKERNVTMELHPAGVLVVAQKGERHIIPYARIKSIMLG